MAFCGPTASKEFMAMAKSSCEEPRRELRLLLVDSFGVSFKIRVPETVRVGTTLKVTIHTCFRCDFSLGGWSSSWPYRRAGEDFCKKCWHARV